MRKKQRPCDAHPGFPTVTVIAVHQVDYAARYIVQVEDRRVCVQAGGMELVAILHGQLSKRGKVPLPHGSDHLLHPAWYHTLCPVLTETSMQPHHIAHGHSMYTYCVCLYVCEYMCIVSMPVPVCECVFVFVPSADCLSQHWSAFQRCCPHASAQH